MTLTLPGSLHGISQGLHVGIPMQPGPEAVATARRLFLTSQHYTSYNWSALGDVPMVYSTTSQGEMQAIRTAAQNGDSRLWLVENEPTPNGQGQSPSTPQSAAIACREIAGLGIKWAGFGLLLAYNSPTWDDWITDYLAAGGPVPDVWHMHNYSHFAGTWHGALDDFIAWTANQGISRPIILTECGGWSQMPPNEQTWIMEAVISAIASKAVHAAFWFSSYYPLWPGGNLLHPTSPTTYDLTEMGRRYLEMRARAEYRPLPPPPDPGHTIHLPSIHG